MTRFYSTSSKNYPSDKREGRNTLTTMWCGEGALRHKISFDGVIGHVNGWPLNTQVLSSVIQNLASPDDVLSFG